MDDAPGHASSVIRKCGRIQPAFNGNVLASIDAIWRERDKASRTVKRHGQIIIASEQACHALRERAVERAIARLCTDVERRGSGVAQAIVTGWLIAEY